MDKRAFTILYDHVRLYPQSCLLTLVTSILSQTVELMSTFACEGQVLACF